MRVVMMLGAFVVMMGTAMALDVHPDQRFASGECRTWGSGKFRSVSTYMRIKETWDPRRSNYPVGYAAREHCQYDGEPAPKPERGEYIVPTQTCAAKRVIPKVCDGGPKVGEKCHAPADCPEGLCVPGTEPATSYPVVTIGVTNDYNEGW